MGVVELIVPHWISPKTQLIFLVLQLHLFVLMTIITSIIICHIVVINHKFIKLLLTSYLWVIN